MGGRKITKRGREVEAQVFDRKHSSQNQHGGKNRKERRSFEQGGGENDEVGVHVATEQGKECPRTGSKSSEDLKGGKGSPSTTGGGPLGIRGVRLLEKGESGKKMTR